MYIVIYSKSPWLLGRLCTDLQCEGWEVNLPWCKRYNPFVMQCRYMLSFDDGIFGNKVQFHRHGYYGFNHIRLTLTSRNYLRVLGEIVNSK